MTRKKHFINSADGGNVSDAIISLGRAIIVIVVSGVWLICHYLKRIIAMLERETATKGG